MSPVSVRCVVVLGATSLVGGPVLAQLLGEGFEVLAVSRHPPGITKTGVTWCLPAQLWGADVSPALARFGVAPWVSLAPLWALGDSLANPLVLKPSRIIALSSTSLFSKVGSCDPAERQIAQKLAEAEDRVTAWAAAHSVPWLLFRPTLIHGFGRDRNVADIARFIRRYGFFPLLGQGRGLRRPIHATEVASACVSALKHDGIWGQALTLSGAETLSYAEMVERVFVALDRPPRVVRISRRLLKFGLRSLHRMGLGRAWSIGMADRMDQDLDYPSDDACEKLGLQFRAFAPEVIAAQMNVYAKRADSAPTAAISQQD
ncbi:MAG: NAD(P)-dependent oxidoreductase [Uliginosibacterium sp.]|nr:NAD(P)-dependent oxidoreductase [Uliginosibacterium sp.]